MITWLYRYIFTTAKKPKTVTENIIFTKPQNVLPQFVKTLRFCITIIPNSIAPFMNNTLDFENFKVICVTTNLLFFNTESKRISKLLNESLKFIISECYLLDLWFFIKYNCSLSLNVFSFT